MTQNIFDLLETGSARISTPATVKNTTPAEPETRFKTWKFLGGKVIANTEKERFQIVFNEIPDKEIREELKHNGFKWSPTNNAWQRLLNFNSVVALRRLPYLSKIAGSLCVPAAGPAVPKLGSKAAAIIAEIKSLPVQDQKILVAILSKERN